MRNELASRILDSRRIGVEYGFTAANMLLLLAMYNIADDYLPEDKQGEFAKALEAEENRIYSTTCNNSPDDIGALYVGHAEEIRRKWGMAPLEDVSSM